MATTKEPLRMRDVCARTGLARSTIHHYIREGVLPKPPKTGRNTAVYDEDFVRRVQLVRALQERARLPLATIRDTLREMSVGAVDAIDVERFTDITRTIADNLRLASEQPIPRTEVLSSSGLLPSELDRLEAAGLIERAGDARYSPLNARIAIAFGRLRRAGVPIEQRGYGEVVRAYRKHLTALARAEARAMIRMMRTLAAVDLGEFIQRSAEPVGDLVAALHQKALVRALTELGQNGRR